jgi:hypothetical protein
MDYGCGLCEKPESSVCVLTGILPGQLRVTAVARIFDGVDVRPKAGQTDVVVPLIVEHSQIRGHDITLEEPGAAVEAGGHACGRTTQS